MPAFGVQPQGYGSGESIAAKATQPPILAISGLILIQMFCPSRRVRQDNF